MSNHLTISYSITNLAQEKSRFFNDHTYNPQFVYLTPPSVEYLNRYGTLDPLLINIAEKIIAAAKQQFGSVDAMRRIEGPLVDKTYTLQTITNYLKENRIEDSVILQFSEHQVPRTAINIEGEKCLLKIRLPIAYKQNSLNAILDHELGTHVFRWINEFRRPWHHNRKKFNFKDHVETEEGLATLHTHLSHPNPFMWQPAVYIKAAEIAQTTTFAQTFKQLEELAPYPEERWLLTTRVKRGLHDTTQPGGFLKDKLYLQGALKIAQLLTARNLEIRDLYQGKIALEDIQRSVDRADVALPRFMGKHNYPDRLNDIITTNFLC